MAVTDVVVLTGLLQRIAERGQRPSIVAIRKEGAESWTYHELARTARAFAAGLRDAGLGAGDRVALVAPNQPSWIAACLGVIASGGVAVPLDVQLDNKTLEGVLRDSGARMILTTSDQAERIGPLQHDADRGVFLLDRDGGDPRSWQSLLAEPPETLPELEPDNLAALFYTSGTTGPPKGVPLTHLNLATQLGTIAESHIVQQDDRVLLPLPLHHVYPFVVGMLAPLSLGLPLILPRSLTGPDILQALQEGEVSVIIGVPRLYEALYEALHGRASLAVGRTGERVFEGAVGLSAWLRRRLKLHTGELMFEPLHRRIGPRLRVLASGGSPLDPELGWKLEGVGWQVAIGYGLTETSPLLSINPPGAGHLDSVGRPIRDVELRIDTSVNRQSEAPENSAGSDPDAPQVGEILARGPSVFGGYWNLPEKTRQALTEDGWFRTGDLGYLDAEGRLHVTGRVSTMIVTEQGENIQPDDVEEAYGEAPEIREIGVLEEHGRLVALVVPETRQRRGDAPPEERVRRAIQQKSKELPSYQRLTDFVLARAPLPRTRLGKIRRHELKERFDAARRGTDDAHRPSGPLPLEEMSPEDRSLVESPAVRRVWDWLAERFPEQRLTPDTSPELDLGVDSMQWLNLTMEIVQRTGIELNDETLARIETVRDLLEEVRRSANTGGDDSTDLFEHPEQMLSKRQQKILQPLGPTGAAIHRRGFALNRLIVQRAFHLEIEGREHLPKHGPFVITPNHVSHLDPCMIAASLDRDQLEQTYWAAWVGATGRNPLTRWASRYAQTLPIDPQEGVLSSLAFGAAVLRRDHILVWFPEGQRAKDGRLQPFKVGLGILLRRYRVPVVPASIRGTFEALPPGAHLPRLRQTRLRYGPPLDPETLATQGRGDEPQERIVDALHSHVAELGGF